MITVWMPPRRSDDPVRDRDGVHLATGMNSVYLVCRKGWNQYLYMVLEHSTAAVFEFAEEQIKLEEAFEVLAL